MKKLAKFMIASLAVLGLVGCSPSNPADVLKAGPESTASFIADALASGDGAKLCEISNLIEPGSCEEILSSEGLGSKPTPSIIVSPIVADAVRYTFAGESEDSRRYEVVLSAVPYRTESGDNWKYEIDVNISRESQAFGVEYDGISVAPLEEFRVMPGKFGSKLKVLEDSAAWFKHSVENGADRFTVTDKATKHISEAVMTRCVAASSAAAPSASDLDELTNSSFVLVSVKPQSKCQSSEWNDGGEFAPDNLRWDVYSTYLVTGYEDWGWLGKPKVEFTLQHKFYSTWKYENGEWIQEDFDFFDN